MKIRGGPAGLDERGRPTGVREAVDLGPQLDLRTDYTAPPVERRPATPEELARLDVAPAAPVVRAGPSMHIPRPAARSAPPSTPRAEPTETPGVPFTPVSEEETTMTMTVAPPEAAIDIPCTTCLHAVVCSLRVHIPDVGRPAATPLAEGLRLFATGWTVECDHYLAPALKAVEPEPIRREHGGESWRTNEESPMRVREASIEELKPAKRHPSSKGEDQAKAERARAALEAVARHGGDRRAAADELGIRPNALAMILKFAEARVPAESQAVAS